MTIDEGLGFEENRNQCGEKIGDKISPPW